MHCTHINKIVNLKLPIAIAPINYISLQCSSNPFTICRKLCQVVVFQSLVSGDGGSIPRRGPSISVSILYDVWYAISLDTLSWYMHMILNKDLLFGDFAESVLSWWRTEIIFYVFSILIIIFSSCLTRNVRAKEKRNSFDSLYVLP